MLIKTTKKKKLLDALNPIDSLVDIDDIVEINPIIINSDKHIKVIEMEFNEFIDELQTNKIYIDNKPYLTSLLNEAFEIRLRLEAKIRDIGSFYCHLASIYEQHMNNFILDKEDRVDIDYKLWDKRNEMVHAYKTILEAQLKFTKKLNEHLCIFIGAGGIGGKVIPKRHSKYSKEKTVALEWAIANLGIYNYQDAKSFHAFLENTTTYFENGKQCTMKQIAATMGQLRKDYRNEDDPKYELGRQKLDGFTIDIVSALRKEIKKLDKDLAQLQDKNIMPPSSQIDVFPRKAKT